MTQDAVNGIFNDNFQSYSDYGYRVVPITPGHKAPLIREWQKRDFYISVDFNDYGIGLLTGKLSGVVAIDIDDEGSFHLVPESPVRKKGQRGETRFFKYNGEASSKRHDLGVEVLSNGNQTVLPPTMHPGTMLPYVWLTIDTLLNFDKNDLPTLPADFLNIPIKTVQTDESHGRHNKLIDMALAAHSKNKSILDIVTELMMYDEQKHNPPYFKDKTQSHKGTGLQAAVNMALNTFKTAYDRGMIEQPIQITITDEKISEAIIDYKENKLPEFRGVAQEIFKYIYSNSAIPRTRFSVASTLATMSTLISNSFHCSGIYPHMYILIVGESGSGKNWPLLAPTDIFMKAQCMGIIGGSPESDSGITSSLTIQNTRLDTFDEAATLFSSMNNTENSYAAKMANVYASLFTSAGRLYTGKTLKSGVIGRTMSPCVNIIGAMTMHDFQTCFTSNLVVKGVGARFLFFADSEYKDISASANKTEINSKILDFAHSFKEKWSGNDMNSPCLYTNSKNIPISPAASALAIRISNEYRSKATGNSVFEATYNRAGEVIMKLAIHDTIGQYKRELTVDSLEWAIAWYRSYEVSCATLFKYNLFNKESSLISSDINQAIRESGKYGISKVDLLHSYCVKQKHSLRSKELDVYLRDLLDAEDIFAIQRKTEGRTSTIFFNKNFVKTS